MRDKKLYPLLFISLFSLLVSFTLLFTWGYDYYFNRNKKPETLISNSNAQSPVNSSSRDSLQKLYTYALDDLGNKINSTRKNADSLNGDMDVKLREFYTLKNEIADLLQNRNPEDDLSLARQKIGELQKKTEELRNRNILVEDENKRLTTILQQLSREMGSTHQTVKPIVFENNPLPEKINSTAVFNAFEMRLSAVMTDEDKEIETSQAQEAEKLVGSFAVRNNNSQLNVAEMQVVILQPDGQVLKSSPWESGTFETREGKKVYSYKLRFDYNKGEAKRLNFSLSSDKYQKGDYMMQVYHNGMIIGRVSKRLS